MSVELVGCTTIAWDKFTSSCVKAFGKSPTRELDAKGIKVGNILSFGFAVEVMNRNEEALGSISKMERSLDFIHLMFAITFDDYDQFPLFCNLAPMSMLQFQIRAKGFGLYSGSLREFRTLVIQGSCKDQPEEIRKTCNEINKYIEMLGFTGLCGSKKHLLDKTYTLEG